MASAVKRAELVMANLGQNEIRTFKEDASETFVKNDLVILTSGYVVEAQSNTNEKILGIALDDATGTQGSDIRVLVLRDGMRLRMSAYHASAGSAVTAQASVGSPTQIITTSAGVWCVDVANIGANAASTFVIVGIEGTVGETYGRYLVEVARSHQSFDC